MLNLNFQKTLPVLIIRFYYQLVMVGKVNGLLIKKYWRLGNSITGWRGGGLTFSVLEQQEIDQTQKQYEQYEADRNHRYHTNFVTFLNVCLHLYLSV